MSTKILTLGDGAWRDEHLRMDLPALYLPERDHLDTAHRYGAFSLVLACRRQRTWRMVGPRLGCLG